MKIIGLDTFDVRFPTSGVGDGSDAMHADPAYSLAYAILRTDTGPEGHGFTFTIGRGNELCVAAVEALAPLVVGVRVEEALADLGGFWRRLTRDSQLRWVGPEKGVIHLATAAIVNAIWDLYAKREDKPLWKLLAELSPEELVSCIDLSYLTDALTPAEAVEILQAREPTKAQRAVEMEAKGLPAYTTSAGWLRYSDDRLRERTRAALVEGWTRLKLKVGREVEADARRASILREELGSEARLMFDANQIWEVDEAITNVRRLAEFDPFWIEEPTSPDDVLGHAAIARAIAPIRVATGEHVHNRVMFKQFLQADAIGFCQLDPCRLGGVSEALAVVLMAAKFGVPVCPHAGGVGLPQLVQHLAFFDYVSVSGENADRMLEYVDHFHEHLVSRPVVEGGSYFPPQSPGHGAELRREALVEYRFPTGSQWKRLPAGALA